MKKIEVKINKITLLILEKIGLKSLVVILILLFSNTFYSQNVLTSTSGSYTIPAGVTAVNVQIWGGGGSGGGSSSTTGGSGGGGGGYTTKTFAVTAGNTITYTIGAGGLANGTGQNGNNGFPTNVTGITTMVASGGTKGNANSTAAGGAGGVISGVAPNAAGSPGSAGSTSKGGDGGNAGNTTTTFGAGNTNGNGTAGTVPGGGGGGGRKNTSNAAGGAGGAGQIIITCNPTITALSATSGCVGSTLTITGTNFYNITAANVTIGGTPVTSITYTPTSIVAVIGSGTTGTVSVTNIAGTGTSASTFTVNPLPAIPTIVTPSASNVCNSYGVAINLNATSAGNTIYWYDAASGGTNIGTVASGVDLSVTPTYSITYSAEAHSAAGCVSPRVATTDVTIVEVEFTMGSNDKTYTISGSACGTITGGGQNDLDIAVGDPGGSATYQWQVSYDGGTTWMNGPGPTSTTTQYVLDPVYTIYETTAGVYKFRVVITNLGCSAVSDVITLTNTSNYTFTPGTISATQYSCTAPFTPAAFTQTAPTGGTSYTYQWQQSPNGTTGWVNVTGGSGATSSIYTPPSISTTTYYRRTAKSNGGCTGGSNVIAIIIGAPMITVTNPTAVCYSASAQTTTLNYNVTSGTPTTYSITWNGTPTNTFAAVTNAALGASITINIPAGTLAGTYVGNITVKNAGGCVSTSIPFNVVVNALPTTPTISAGSATTFCSGGSVTLTSVAGTTYLWSTGATTQSTVVTTSGSYSVKVTNVNGCQSLSSSNTIVTVNSNPIVPDVETVTSPTCASVTGNIHFHNLPLGSWTLNQYGTATSTTLGSGDNTTIYNLAAGTYNYTITNANGCVSPSTSNINIIGLTTTTWNGSAWTNGIPNSEMNIVFAGSYSSTGTLTGCTCTINSGAVVINSADDLVITNNINTTGGSLTFENNSNLIQLNSSAINTGNITYKRNATIKQYDYVYWSSPVSGFTINNLSLTQTPGPKYSWNPTVANGNGGQGNWVSAEGSVMSTGKGYIVRAPNSFTSTPSTFSASFVGIPINGTIPVSVSRGTITGAPIIGTNGTQITNLSDNWNLIGNPYPSSIRANQFLLDNQATIEGSVRLWMHGTSPLNSVASPFYGTYTYNYTPNDYLTYNFTGTSVGPVAANELFIGAGQGFFVEMLDGPAASANVNFSNTLRSSTYDNSTFYKSNSASATATSEKDRIWLDIVNSNNQSERTLIGYVDGATNSKDNLYDASYNVTNSIAIYSLINSDKMTIQGRALPFNPNDIVPIGINVNTAGNYNIAIGAVDGLFNDQNIYVEDTYLNIIHDLKQSPYSFSSAVGIYNDRFKIRYTNNNLSNSTFENVNSIAFITNDKLKIQSYENIQEITLFDITGKFLIKYNTNTKSNYFEANFNFPKGIYFSKIKLESGFILNQKLMN